MLRLTITTIQGLAFLLPGTLAVADFPKTSPFLFTVLLLLAVADAVGVVAIVGFLRRKGYFGGDAAPRSKQP